MFLPDNLDSPAATSQSQSQRREILRPPPFPHFNTATQQSSLEAKDENDGNVAVQDGRYYDQKKLLYCKGFINVFNRRATGSHRWAKLFEWNLILGKKNFPLHGQTRQAKSSSQPVILSGTWPLMKPLT